MSIQMTWDNEEKTIIRLDVGEEWGWTDAHDALAIMREMRATTDHLLGVIANMENASLLPLQGAIPNLKYILESEPHPLVLVGAKSLGKTLFDILGKIKPPPQRKVLFASTLDEARKLLHELKGKV